MKDLIGCCYNTMANCNDVYDFGELISRMNTCIVKEPALVTAPKGDALIVGDLHGNIDSTNWFALAARLALMSREVSSVVFLGDYVDRGEYSVEVLRVLFDLKLDFPDKVFLIRGNHELRSVVESNLSGSLIEKFGSQGSVFTSRLYDELFLKMPLAVEIPFKNGEKVLCTHGGIPTCDKYVSEKDITEAFAMMRHYNAQVLFGRYGHVLRQIMWNDPSVPANRYNPIKRRQFSEEQLISFLSKFGYRNLIRGHEFTHYIREDFGGKCYTVFSSQDYCGQKNNAYMAIATPLGVFDYM